MGTSSAKVIESPRPQAGPEFYWLSPSDSSILKITPNSVFYHSIPSFSVYAECAIGYTPENNIIVVGGVKPTGKLSKKVFYINVKSKSINRLASITSPSKRGQVLFNDGKIYLIEESLTLPIQVYNKGKWDFIKPQEIELSSTTCFLNESNLVVLASIKGNSKPSKKIWTLDLDRPNKFLYTGKQTPFKLIKPVVVKMKDCIIVAGGSNHLGKNLNFFVGDLNYDRWKTIEGPNYHITTSPGICVDNTAFWIEIPKVIMLNGYSCCVCSIFEGYSQDKFNENNKSPIVENQDKTGKEKELKNEGKAKVGKIDKDNEKEEERKVRSFSFKKTEFKEKKIIEKKLNLEQNILGSEKIDPEFYVKSEDTLGKEKCSDKDSRNTPVFEDSFKNKIEN